MRYENEFDLDNIPDKKDIKTLAKRFDSIASSLRRSGRTQIADALADARSKIMLSNSLSDDQKQARMGAINKIGEESASKKPDRNFFSRMRDSLAQTTVNPMPSDPFIAGMVVEDIGAFVEHITHFVKDIDWGSIDIGNIDFGGF